MRWAALALVTLAHACTSLAALAVASLAPFLLEAFALSRVQVGLLLPAIYLGGVLMALPAGWLTDRLGAGATLSLGGAVTGAMIVAAAFTSGLPSLLAYLVAAGFGFSAGNPAAGRAVLDWFPPRERGVAMGVKQTGLTLGGIAGALLLPPLAVAYGWREPLAVAGALSLLASIIVLLAYRRPARDDAPAVVTPPRLAELGQVMRRRGVLVLFACGFLLSITQASLLAYLTLYARDAFAFSLVAAGQLLALAQAGGTASRLVWGVVSDHFFGGRRRPGVVATALIGAAVYALFALGETLPPVLLVALGPIAGAGAFGWVGLYFALVAEIGGARYAGLLTGVAVVFAWSGVLIGPPLFGLLVEVFGSYAPSWLLLAVLGVSVAVALARLEPLVQRDPAL